MLQERDWTIMPSISPLPLPPPYAFAGACAVIPLYPPRQTAGKPYPPPSWVGGAQGQALLGFRTAQASSTMPLARVLEAVWEILSTTFEREQGACDICDRCPLHGVLVFSFPSLGTLQKLLKWVNRAAWMVCLQAEEGIVAMAFTLGLQWGQCDVLVMLVFLLQFCPFPLDIIAFNLTFLTCKMGVLSRRGCCWEHRLLLYIWSTLRGPCIWLTLSFSHSWLRRFVLSCSVQMYGVWTWRKLRNVRDVYSLLLLQMRRPRSEKLSHVPKVMALRSWLFI